MTTVKFPSARVPDFIKSEHWLLNSQYYFALQQIFRPGDTTADSELQTLTIHETSHKNVQVQIDSRKAYCFSLIYGKIGLL